MDLSHHSQPSSSLKLFHFSLHSSNNNFPVSTFAIVGILATAFLLISYYFFVTKCCLNLHQTNITSLDSFNSFEELEAQKGLEEYIIRSIPIIKFQKMVKQRRQTQPGSSKPDPDTSYECSICLNEFEDGEKLRVIPICCHAFHIDCIDIWLQNNASCPLCRSGISPGSVLVPNDDLRVFYRGVGKEDDGFVVIEIEGNNLDEPRLVCSNNNEGDQVKKKKKKKKKMKKMSSSIGDEWIDNREKDCEFRVDQPMRRSISMDLSIDRELLMEIQPSYSDSR